MLTSELAAQIASADVSRLGERLHATAPVIPLKPAGGDHDLNPSMPRHRILSPAAVLLPIIAKEEPAILFTRRTPHLARHAGQVSFPGGRMDESDVTALSAALRETQEETGIAPQHIRIAGFLDPYETGSGFAIIPVVGVLTPGFELLPDPNEVAEVFEVPLAFLLARKNRQRQQMEWQGRLREFYAFTYGDHYIWGATAGILVNFADRLTVR